MLQNHECSHTHKMCRKPCIYLGSPMVMCIHICMFVCSCVSTVPHAHMRHHVKFSWKQLYLVIHSFNFIRSVALCRWPQSETVSGEPTLSPPEVKTAGFYNVLFFLTFPHIPLPVSGFKCLPTVCEGFQSCRSSWNAG